MADPEIAKREARRRYGSQAYRDAGTDSARDPVPKVRGNLPPTKYQASDDEGREVASPPMKGYERATPSTSSALNYTSKPWGPYPEPPPGISAGRGMTESDIAGLRKKEPTAMYARGGPVLPRSGSAHLKRR